MEPDYSTYYEAGYAEHINSWIVPLDDKNKDLVVVLDAYIFEPSERGSNKDGSALGYFKKVKIDYMLLKDIVKSIPAKELDKYL